MTDHDRNMRTLVTCFVVAIVSLAALRFVEIGNMTDMSTTKVLGVTNQRKVVILPSAEIQEEVLEARYIGQ